MGNFTPQQIVDALRVADKDLELVATQFAWFKGQREYWQDVYDLEFAKAKVRHDSKYGGNEAATEAVSSLSVEIVWGDGGFISLPQMVRLTSASFDLISKRYAYLENHITILQSVNKNVLLDYQRPN